MNTKPIPVIITLIAAGISCVASLIQNVGLHIFTVRLLVTVICFYIIGSIVRVAFDRGLKTMDETKDEETSESENEEDVDLEDVETRNDVDEES